jgi:iron complex outermembrane receptor protein
MIERTDILLDGASSVYGSDAIAGVVNLILRDDFDGVVFGGQITAPQEGGG